MRVPSRAAASQRLVQLEEAGARDALDPASASPEHSDALSAGAHASLGGGPRRAHANQREKTASFLIAVAVHLRLSADSDDLLADRRRGARPRPRLAVAPDRVPSHGARLEREMRWSGSPPSIGAATRRMISRPAPLTPTLA